MTVDAAEALELTGNTLSYILYPSYRIKQAFRYKCF